nr:heparan-alpha-glucosaminide N-acetyltransferase-like isoform X1 [Ipomoea batatas]
MDLLHKLSLMAAITCLVGLHYGHILIQVKGLPLDSTAGVLPTLDGGEEAANATAAAAAGRTEGSGPSPPSAISHRRKNRARMESLPLPRACLQNSPTCCHHAMPSKIRRRSGSPPVPAGSRHLKLLAGCLHASRARCLSINVGEEWEGGGDATPLLTIGKRENAIDVALPSITFINSYRREAATGTPRSSLDAGW